MDILVGVHVQTDWNPGINAAKISLDDAAIEHILRAAKASARDGLKRSTYDSTPELGTSDLDLEVFPYRDIAKLTDEDTQQLVFTELPEEGRSEIVELHMDGTDFWWEGVFKFTDVHWNTRMIPLSFLPKPAKIESGLNVSLPDLNMTAEEMNAIHEKIAQGMNSGLNAREIDRTFNRHVTKAQLIRLLMEHIERNH
jgi:hypothetical protein